MRRITNQELILASLLNSPKTTAELAKELGYIDSEGTARYNIISNDLKGLEKHGYVESKKEKLGKKPGNIPTLYSIIYSFQSLKKILKEFPGLIENMQGSELVLETIVDENLSWICNSTEEKYVEQIEPLKLLTKRGTENWKEKLRLSKEFFRYCLYSNYTNMMGDVEKLSRASNEYWETTFFELKTTSTSSVFLWNTNYRLEMIFKACVASDILRGESTREAIEYLEKKKNEVLEEQYKQLKEYYTKTKVAPEFLKGKEFIPVENPKLRELEQEFMDKGGKFVN